MPRPKRPMLTPSAFRSLEPSFRIARALQALNGPSLNTRTAGLHVSDFDALYWTRDCSECPMRAQESRAGFRTTRSTLIREFPH